MLLFLVRLNNSNRFQIYRATHCFSSRLFLHALDTAVVNSVVIKLKYATTLPNLGGLKYNALCSSVTMDT